MFLLLKINWAWLGGRLVLNSISRGKFNFTQELFGNIMLGVENGCLSYFDLHDIFSIGDSK